MLLCHSASLLLDMEEHTTEYLVGASGGSELRGKDSICCRLNTDGSDVYAIGLTQLSGSLERPSALACLSVERNSISYEYAESFI